MSSIANESSDLTSTLLGDTNGTPKSADLLSQSYAPTSITNTQNNSLDDDHKLKSISIGKRLMANLIPSTAFQPLKIPFPDEEHYLLGFDSNYYVNDKNLSSIVAFTLSSKEYKEFLLNSNKTDQNKQQPVVNQAPNSAQTSGSSSQVGTKENFVLITNALQDIGNLSIFRVN